MRVQWGYSQGTVWVQSGYSTGTPVLVVCGGVCGVVVWWWWCVCVCVVVVYVILKATFIVIDTSCFVQKHYT